MTDADGALLGAMVRYLRERQVAPGGRGNRSGSDGRAVARAKQDILEQLRETGVGVVSGPDDNGAPAVGRTMEGEPVVVAFTDPEAGLTWTSRDGTAPAGATAGLLKGGSGMIGMALETEARWLWLNPAGPAGVAFSQDELGDRARRGPVFRRRPALPEDPLMEQERRAAHRRRWQDALTQGIALRDREDWEGAEAQVGAAQREASSIGDLAGMAEAAEAMVPIFVARNDVSGGAYRFLQVAQAWSDLGVASRCGVALAASARCAVQALASGVGDQANMRELGTVVAPRLARLAVPGTEQDLASLQAALAG